MRPTRVVCRFQFILDPCIVGRCEMRHNATQRSGQFEGDFDRSVGDRTDPRIDCGTTTVEGKDATEQMRIGLDQQSGPIVVSFQIQRVAQVLSVVSTGFDKKSVFDVSLQQGQCANVLILRGPIVVRIGSRKVGQLVGLGWVTDMK